MMRKYSSPVAIAYRSRLTFDCRPDSAFSCFKVTHDALLGYGFRPSDALPLSGSKGAEP